MQFSSYVTNPAQTLHAGSGEPVVLLHGVTCSALVWRHVIPLLSSDFAVTALTALGHRGGRPVSRHVTIRDVVDDVERQLDALDLESAHLVGNSMGGWVALELARRGRARTVCALSPAGCWDLDEAGHGDATSRLRRIALGTQFARPLLPYAARLPWVRRVAMRDNAVRGDRLSVKEFMDLADDLLGCTVRDDLLATTEQLDSLDPLPCPVLLAWSGVDRIFPVRVYGSRARALFPSAEWTILEGVGHLPMIDSPDLVADVIRSMLVGDRASPGD